MKIIGARLKPVNGNSEYIFVRGRIKGLIEKNRNDIFQFNIDENDHKSSKIYGPDDINLDLVNKKIIIIGNNINDESYYYALFNRDGTIDIIDDMKIIIDYDI
jgi:hypothetical protein